MIFCVNGATGWLGRTTLSHLMSRFDHPELLAIASKKRNFEIQGKAFELFTQNEVKEFKEIEIYFDFAFLTKEYEKKMQNEEYLNYNRNLILKSEELIRKLRPRYIFLASSGAVYSNLNQVSHKSLYGELKLEQERRIQTVADEVGAQLAVCRIFNLSGVFIGKSETFALSNFLSSAHLSQKIEITSPTLTFRRYCDAEELIELIIAMWEKDESNNFDSGGHKIELHELAKIAARVVNKNVKVARSNIVSSNAIDSYYSQNQKYEEYLERYLKRKPMPLIQQVDKTYRGMFL